MRIARSTRFAIPLLAIVLSMGGVGCDVSCPTALLEGVLVASGESELAIQRADGLRSSVQWPGGHSVRADGDELVLTNPIGIVVAREGDYVRMGGGEAPDGSGAFRACGPIAVGAPS
jgi:hypothetical protein